MTMIGLERMASTNVVSPPILQPLSPQSPRNAATASFKVRPSRRQLLFTLTSAPMFFTRESASMAQDIPLFGIRKKLKKAEETTEELVREGFEAADKGLETAAKGLETAEKGVESVERGIETAEREIEAAVSFGGLAQASAVAGAEVVGVLVATAIVNGILGPESQRS